MGCGASVDEAALQRERELEEKLTKKREAAAHQKKLLLLGPGNSGKSTFFKQLLHIHTGDFSLMTVGRREIHTSLIMQVHHLSTMMVERGHGLKLEIDEATMKECEFFLDTDETEEITDELAAHISKWWAKDCVRKAFEKRDNLGIVDSTPHFLDRIGDIADPAFKPDEHDMLLVRTKTTGITKKEFAVQDDHGREHEFVIYDCGGQRSERKKWFKVFSDTTAILYVASLSCYDQLLYEELSVNGMKEALDLFTEILESSWFKDTAVILFLNKLDLFEEKIKRVPLTVCFPEYTGTSEPKEAGEYIKKQFDACNEIIKRAIFSHFTCATDRDTVKRVFANVQQIVVQQAMRAAQVW
jgi:GTPase SAR1 family protein